MWLQVRKLGFTGSTRAGKFLMGKAADTVKRVSMELGGNAPFIIFQDADLDAAAAAVAGSGLFNAGQVCIAGNRLLVHVRHRDSSAVHSVEWVHTVCAVLVSVNLCTLCMQFDHFVSLWRCMNCTRRGFDKTIVALCQNHSCTSHLSLATI